jgi:histidinol-phosphatase (PHP family)
MIQTDYHMHTKRCGHAHGEVADYIAQAKRKGLAEIGFSDHLPFVTHRDAQYTMDMSELPSYHHDIEEAAARHKDLVIKVGIEADYMEGQTEKIKALVESYSYDFVIGSVHFIKKWAFDDPREKAKWNNADVDMVYSRYYDLLQQSAKSGIYDIMGHCDLVKKFGHRPLKDFTDEVEKTARVFKENGVCLEINTSGLRKPVKEIYPQRDLLKIYHKHGVPIVFGSDAHASDHVGADFDKARDLALSVGYDEYQIFSKRKIVKSIPL